MTPEEFKDLYNDPRQLNYANVNEILVEDNKVLCFSNETLAYTFHITHTIDGWKLHGIHESITNGAVMIRKLFDKDDKRYERYEYNNELEKLCIEKKIHFINGYKISKTYDNGMLSTIIYSVGCKIHCTNGPAKSLYTDGILSSEYYIVNGKRHRKKLPAIIWYYPNGQIKKTHYYEYGVRILKIGKNITKWHDNGAVAKIRYYIENSASDSEPLFSLHRDDGPASIDYDRKGDIIYECYKKNGVCYREEGPAEIEYYSNKRIQSIYYVINNVSHRDDGPADIEYYPNGNIKRIIYKKKGECHREEGSATIEYFSNGQISMEVYYTNGFMHRDDGPAITYYHKNGNISLEKWYHRGTCHREEGPAIIRYRKNKQIRAIVYYREGKIHREYKAAYKDYYKNNTICRKAYIHDGYFTDFKPYKEYYTSGQLFIRCYLYHEKLLIYSYDLKFVNGSGYASLCMYNNKPSYQEYDIDGTLVCKKWLDSDGDMVTTTFSNEGIKQIVEYNSCFGPYLQNV